jgi:hypothetical protein
MKPHSFNNRAPRNGHPLSDKGRASIALNTREVTRKFGDGLRFGITIKGEPVEYVPNHSACITFLEPGSKSFDIRTSATGRTNHHASGYRWVPADTTSPAYIDALDTIPRCMECRVVRWNQHEPCHYCLAKMNPELPSYEDDDRDELTGDEK